MINKTKKIGIIKNLYKNREYILFYSRIMLKQRVAGSYLGFLWLFLQPLMFMLIYSFVVMIIFNNRMENFNIYVLIGLNTWSLIQRTIMISATSIVRNKSLFEQVYFHKFVFPTVYMLSYTYEFLIATSLVFILMAFSGVSFTWHLLEIIPILLVCMLFALGCGLIIAHIGVYLFDLANILEFTLRFIFYLSPIMWSHENLNFTYMWILRLNPVSVLLGSFRSCILYGKSPVYIYLIILGIFSCILINIGYRLISKHEDSYARIV